MKTLCFLIVSTFSFCNVILAEEVGEQEQIQYIAIRSVLTANPATVSGHTSAHVRLVPHIKSKLDNVKPQEVELTLTLGEDRFQLVVNADGSFQLPLDEKWNQEAAWILTNQPQGSLILSLQGHIYLGSLTATHAGNSSIVRLSHVFPSMDIKRKAKETIAAAFPDAKAKVTTPEISVAQFRNGANESPTVTVLSPDGESVIDMDSKGTFTLSRARVKTLGPATMRLTPVDGWSWRVKARGLPWQTWVEISVKQEEAEP